MADKFNEEQQDDIARIVVERYRRAAEYKKSNVVFQGKSIDSLLYRARHQYKKEYTAEDRSNLAEAFNFCPTRYYGLVQLKVNAVKAWKSDLMINNLDSCFTINPSPEPSLDKASIETIRQGVRQELVNKMFASGILNGDLLMEQDGNVNNRVEEFLRAQVKTLRKVEQARIVSLAQIQSARAQVLMRDALVQGNFRKEYTDFSHNQILTGVGIMKFPDWRRVPVLRHTGTNVKDSTLVRPMFRNIEPENFFPIPDGEGLQDCSGITELSSIRKVDLINMIGSEDYYDDNIKAVIEDFAYRSRWWLDDSPYESTQDTIPFWGLDETIPMLTHEGYFTGSELADVGIHGYDLDEYVNATIMVCGNRTIRISVDEYPVNFRRTYHMAAFSQIGSNIWDVNGVAAMLWDTEQRINRLFNTYESNMDWSSRPPIIKNTTGMEDKHADIKPGMQYTIEREFAERGDIPEVMRPMSSVSAQYQMIHNEIRTLMSGADEECGIPAYAYGAQDFGRASLGEFTQRLSNSLRVIKQCAMNEDIGFIEPAFTNIFNHLMKTTPEMREGQDVDVVIRGLTGILNANLASQEKQSILGEVIQLNQAGLVPNAVVDYGVRQTLVAAGYPVDSLGMDDPQVDLAVAQATQLPQGINTPAGQQVPQLDGRSRVPISQVANPNGSSNTVPQNPQANDTGATV